MRSSAASSIPALQGFEPDLVLVASGLDANGFDPMGRMLLHSDTYRALTEMLLAFTGGRLVDIHEGGYSDFYVPLLRTGDRRDAGSRLGERPSRTLTWRTSRLMAGRRRCSRSPARGDRRPHGWLVGLATG